jgi:hypothetical protein
LAKIVLADWACVFCSYIAHINMAPAAIMRVIANVLMKHSVSAREMGALGGYDLGRHEPSY